MRKIIHIDMDAFYASVEQRDNPSLRGKPVAVGANPAQRGVVAAASYEARKFGIHSAMPSKSAVARCPHLIFVKPRFDVYKAVSAEIRQIFLDYTDLVEPLSLDEAYLDVTVDKLEVGSALAIAQQIKQRIFDRLQLTASAGVSINKFLAKTASDLDKPDGLSFISPEQAEAFLEQLPIASFYGIGPATAAKMKAQGIETGADLKQWNRSKLIATFGKVGDYYYKIVRAQDDRPVNPNRVRKSIGAERSFSKDLRQIEEMQTALAKIAQEVNNRLKAHERRGYTITLKIKYGNYKVITRSYTLSYLIQDSEQILRLARELLWVHLDRARTVRLLGITISNLSDARAFEQLMLDLVE